MEISRKRINSMIATLESKKRISECRGFKYKGHRLTYADATEVICYLEDYAVNGYFDSSKEPFGVVKKVLEQLGFKLNNSINFIW